MAKRKMPTAEPYVPDTRTMERYYGYTNFVDYPGERAMPMAGQPKPGDTTGINKPIQTLNTRQDMRPPVPGSNRR